MPAGVVLPFDLARFSIKGVNVGAVAIENVYKFSAFCNPLALRDLWNEDFFELGDNGLWSCRAVVGANARKWSHFGGTLSLFYSFHLRQFNSLSQQLKVSCCSSNWVGRS